ncbi:MAG: zf-HC2 domain-containing protein [Gemmataceae bacterium]|nr:zf-HC2 domain-containing protein [Gemmataceae bacterium]MCI0740554.1 zf-HC2 domain-containing protein [Gemmataceae bacterium]
MTCREVNKLLLDFLQGKLGRAQRRSFQDHLSDCAECKEKVVAHQKTMRISKRVFEAHKALPPVAPDEMIQAIFGDDKDKQKKA